MPQADFILPQFSPIELLSTDCDVAIEEKERAYAISEACCDADGSDADANRTVAEAAYGRAYEAAEDVAGMILSLSAKSASELAIKARVLSARDPYHQADYRPEDLTRFVREVIAFLATEP